MNDFHGWEKLLFPAAILAITVTGCFSSSWDPAGNWVVTISYVEAGFSDTEVFTLTGTSSAGVVTGLTVYGLLPPQTGTYEKTGSYSLKMDFDFLGFGDQLAFYFIGDSSETDPNSLSGSGTWLINGLLENNLQWIASKTSNLQ